MKTSLKLSKLLAENGCELESDFYQSSQLGLMTKKQFLAHDPYNQDKLQDDGFRQVVEETYPAYDLLWDICVKHSKEFFGEDNLEKGGMIYPSNYHVQAILIRLQQNKTQDEIETYLWNVCLFNDKNKV